MRSAPPSTEGSNPGRYWSSSSDHLSNSADRKEEGHTPSAVKYKRGNNNNSLKVSGVASKGPPPKKRHGQEEKLKKKKNDFPAAERMGSDQPMDELSAAKRQRHQSALDKKSHAACWDLDTISAAIPSQGRSQEGVLHQVGLSLRI
eukprot:scaffold351346_cov30-Prasinocladus_malaysianus.AAC.1